MDNDNTRCLLLMTFSLILFGAMGWGLPLYQLSFYPKFLFVFTVVNFLLEKYLFILEFDKNLVSQFL